MPCERIHGHDGTTIIMCSRGSAPRTRKCSRCGERKADLLCDWPNPRKKSGTCDAPICEACTYRPPNVQRGPFPGELVGDTVDLCPEHAQMHREGRTIRISEAMKRMLRSMGEGKPWDHDLRGMSSRGGGASTLLALQRRGLVGADEKLTDLGRRVALGRGK